MSRRARLTFFFCACLVAACGASPRAPEPARVDGDGDGVLDADDECPTDAEDLDGRRDADGCPDHDDDSDDIADVDDRCPCDAEDRDGWEDDDGCPDHDNDRDLIVDACDLCPNEPETYNGGCDEDGCPDRGGICIETSTVQILEHVYFRRGRAELDPRAFPVLDALAATISWNPELTSIALLGHVEPGERRPRELARTRAEAVLEALVSRGVARERLVAEVGDGAAVADLPREEQRRVGFAIRAIDGVALPIVPEGTTATSVESSCSRRSRPCEVPVCTPPVSAPAC